MPNTSSGQPAGDAGIGERAVTELKNLMPDVLVIGAGPAGLAAATTCATNRIVLAGSGPLLLAAAIQLSDRGVMPLAVLERGRPFRPSLDALAMAGFPDYAIEATVYWATLRRRRIEVLQGWTVAGIRRDGEDLLIEAVGPEGKAIEYRTEVIGLHDGIRPNDFGLPEENADLSRPLVIYAGDCRESLGGRAAVAQGRAAGRRVAEMLNQPGDGTPSETDYHIARHRAAQGLIGRLYTAPNRETLSSLPDSTVLCRCENVTIGQLRTYLTDGDPSPREIKLNCRVGMGGCQGRFCAEWANQLRAELLGTGSNAHQSINVNRWPIQPISIADFLGESISPVNSRTCNKYVNGGAKLAQRAE